MNIIYINICNGRTSLSFHDLNNVLFRKIHQNVFTYFHNTLVAKLIYVCKHIRIKQNFICITFTVLHQPVRLVDKH